MGELERLAGDVAQSDAKQGQGRRSQADKLVALAVRNVELFHSPGGNDASAFVTMKVKDHVETWPVHSSGFRRWIAHIFFDEEGKAPNSQALQDALDVLSGIALFRGPEIPVAVRIGMYDNAIYLDLADADWRAVRISADGWEVVSLPAIKFIRRRGM